MHFRTLPVVAFLSLSLAAGCSGAQEGAEDAQGTQAAITRIAPSESGYEAQSAKTKQDVLWSKVADSRYTDGLPRWDDHNEVLGLVTKATAMVADVLGLAGAKEDNRKFYSVTVERNSDEMPEGRKKGIHTLGSVGKVRFEADPNQPYTGLFKGADYGLIRMSLATNPFQLGKYNFVPGLALKFLVDGKPSRNFMAMFSLDGQPGQNYFENNFSNWVNPPEGFVLKLLARAFSTVTRDPTKVDVTHLAQVRQDGTVETKVKAPTKLVLSPNPELRTKFAQYKNEDDLRNELATIQKGTWLYKVAAEAAGPSKEDVPVGTIVLDSDLVASSYGDETLFFRHETIDGK